jgi:hypothetical protein
MTSNGKDNKGAGLSVVLERAKANVRSFVYGSR